MICRSATKQEPSDVAARTSRLGPTPWGSLGMRQRASWTSDREQGLRLGVVAVPPSRLPNGWNNGRDRRPVANDTRERHFAPSCRTWLWPLPDVRGAGIPNRHQDSGGPSASNGRAAGSAAGAGCGAAPVAVRHRLSFSLAADNKYTWSCVLLSRTRPHVLISPTLSLRQRACFLMIHSYARNATVCQNELTIDFDAPHRIPISSSHTPFSQCHHTLPCRPKTNLAHSQTCGYFVPSSERQPPQRRQRE